MKNVIKWLFLLLPSFLIAQSGERCLCGEKPFVDIELETHLDTFWVHSNMSDEPMTFKTSTFAKCFKYKIRNSQTKGLNNTSYQFIDIYNFFSSNFTIYKDTNCKEKHQFTQNGILSTYKFERKKIDYYVYLYFGDFYEYDFVRLLVHFRDFERDESMGKKWYDIAKKKGLFDLNFYEGVSYRNEKGAWKKVYVNEINDKDFNQYVYLYDPLHKTKYKLDEYQFVSLKDSKVTFQLKGTGSNSSFDYPIKHELTKNKNVLHGFVVLDYGRFILKGNFVHGLPIHEFGLYEFSEGKLVGDKVVNTYKILDYLFLEDGEPINRKNTFVGLMNCAIQYKVDEVVKNPVVASIVVEAIGSYFEAREYSISNVEQNLLINKVIKELETKGYSKEASILKKTSFFVCLMDYFK